MMLRSLLAYALALGLTSLSPASAQTKIERRWLAGDHHVHSVYSARYRIDPDHPDHAPDPIIGGDSRHSILLNAQKARQFGLDWMVATDHGGPNHSALNHTRAWPDVVAARQAQPDLILFYGMEFDVPGGEHASLILPHGPAERDMLRDLELRFAERDVFPADPARDQKPRMIAALRYMTGLPEKPVLIANHPSRTATGKGKWGLHAPDEFRLWHATAPDIAIGMEGAPGHQAARPKTGLDAAHGSRGLYGGYPTMGGFDQMVATLGGAWDGLLGQGLHWTITATSDSHGHWSEGGADFWPGEYAKTWVFAAPDAADILGGLRQGRVFAVTGDLVDRLDVSVAAGDAPGRSASTGETLDVRPGEDMHVVIRVRPAQSANGGGDIPVLDHVDLISGAVGVPSAGHNPTTHVVRRFTAEDWRHDGGFLVMEHHMKAPDRPGYVRVRGTNRTEGEPSPDVAGENPWQDLWFYGNPVYLRVRPSDTAAKGLPPRPVRD
ncbi:phosphoesterase [Sphingobium abikonense]|uniref:phosphoesterase n=1 Tax=Sphingobium abikonense TaxID=86193 RepID=UPI0035122DDB